MTPENIRYHAAGHLAAAVLLAEKHPRAAAAILEEVMRFATHPKVSAPPQLTAKILSAAGDPAASARDILLLEAWFVDPFNTVIEKSGGVR